MLFTTALLNLGYTARPDRPLADRYTHFKNLIRLLAAEPVQVVCFISPGLVTPDLPEAHNLIYVNAELSDFTAVSQGPLPAKACPIKDTLAFMAMMNAKPYMVEAACQLVRVQSNTPLAWIDFNVLHCMHPQDPMKAIWLHQTISGAPRCPRAAIHLGGHPIPPLTAPCPDEVCWWACGGFWVATGTPARPAEEVVRDFAATARGFPSNVWEVNNWSLMAGQGLVTFGHNASNFNSTLFRLQTLAQ